MRKIYKYLLLCALAIYGFAAQAVTVTVQFSNVNAISTIKYNWGAGEMSPAKTIVWNTDDMGNLQIYLNPGCTPVSITNSNSGYTYTMGNEYSYNNFGYDPDGDSVTLYGSDFANTSSDGNIIEVTTSGGQEEGGSGEDVPEGCLRFRFTNPYGVLKAFTGSVGGNEVPLTDGYFDYLVENGGMAGFALRADAPSLIDITNVTSGKKLTLNNEYYPSYYQGYESYAISIYEAGKPGDVILINNGEDSGPIKERWEYTIIAPESVVVKSDDGLEVTEYRVDAYYVYATPEDLDKTFTISGDNIISVDVNGVYLTPINGVYTIKVEDYQEKCSFWVETLEVNHIYLNCEQDVLTFTNCESFSYDASAKKYTVVNPYMGFSASIKNEFLSQWEISDVTPSANTSFTKTTVRFTRAGMGDFENLTFTISLTKSPIVYTIVCDEDILDFSSSIPVFDASYSGGIYTIKNYDNIVRVVATVQENKQAQYKLTGVTYTGGTLEVSPEDHPVTFSFNASDFPTNTTFTVTYEEIEQGGGNEGDGEDVDPSTVITIQVTDQNYVSASQKGSALEFHGNKAYIDPDNGTEVSFTTSGGATIANISATDGNGNSTNIVLNGNLPATSITANLNEVPKGSLVNVVLNVPKIISYSFQGPEGLSVMYFDQEATYADGFYTVSGIKSTELFYSVNITVKDGYKDKIQLVNLVKDGQIVATPEDGALSIQSYDYPNTASFIINWQEPVFVEDITFTAELMNGALYQATMYINGSEYSFYDGNPRNITISNNTEIFIMAGGGLDNLYKVLVDGKEIPSSEWKMNGNYSNVVGFTLVPGSEYYPSNNGRIEIYVESPEKTTYDLKFEFVNPNTQSFVSDLQIGFTYYRDEDLVEALTDGLSLDEDTEVTVKFNLMDFDVNSVKVNGVELGGLDGGFFARMNDNLTFTIDVTQKAGGRTVSFNVPDNFEGVVITDLDQLNTWTLSSANEEITFPLSVTEIKIKPAEGYEMSTDSSPITVTTEGLSTNYYANDVIEVVDGMEIKITINKSNSSKVINSLTVYCDEDVLEFTGYPTNPTVVYRDVTRAVGGYYYITDVPEGSLSLNIKEEHQDTHLLKHIEYNGQTLAVGNGVSTSFNVSQLNDGDQMKAVLADNVEVGVETIGDEDGEVMIFNLQGIRVDAENLAPGIYIVNGKKVVIRK